MGRCLAALVLVLICVLSLGCAGTLDTYNTDIAQEIEERATTELAEQVAEFFERTFRVPLPEAVKEALAGMIEDGTHQMVEDLLKAAEERERK